MTISELEQHLTNLIGHITFKYNGYSCGVDPLALNQFDMWCGVEGASVHSITEAMECQLFDGKSLPEIWDDVTEIDY